MLAIQAIIHAPNGKVTIHAEQTKYDAGYGFMHSIDFSILPAFGNSGVVPLINHDSGLACWHLVFLAELTAKSKKQTNEKRHS